MKRVRISIIHYSELINKVNIRHFNFHSFFCTPSFLPSQLSFNPTFCVLINSKFHQYFPFRLESYDRNKNFLPPPVLLPEPLDVNWPSTGFQQLKPDHQGLLPTVTRDQTEAYFLHRLAGFINLNI